MHKIKLVGALLDLQPQPHFWRKPILGSYCYELLVVVGSYKRAAGS